MSGTSRVTRRQLAILRLVALGMTNQQIADMLRLAKETVGWHLRKASRTLGARNRAHAVALAYERQLVQIGEITALEGYVRSGPAAARAKESPALAKWVTRDQGEAK